MDPITLSLSIVEKALSLELLLFQAMTMEQRRAVAEVQIKQLQGWQAFIDDARNGFPNWKLPEMKV